MSTYPTIREAGHIREATPDDFNQRRMAEQLLLRHDHNRSDHDPLTRENCAACVLAGYISRSQRADGAKISDGPDYAGWARVYVQAGRVIPYRWRAAFEAERTRTDNPAYTQALARDIYIFGLRQEVSWAEWNKRGALV